MGESMLRGFTAVGLVAFLLTGCGAGTAAIAGGGGGGGGAASAPVVGSAVSVTDMGAGRPLVSPATIRFNLAFSASSARSRLASEASIPPYFFRQV